MLLFGDSEGGGGGGGGSAAAAGARLLLAIARRCCCCCCCCCRSGSPAAGPRGGSRSALQDATMVRALPALRIGAATGCCCCGGLKSSRLLVLLVLLLLMAAAPGGVDADAHATALLLRLADMRRSTRSMARDDADDMRTDERLMERGCGVIGTPSCLERVYALSCAGCPGQTESWC